MQNCENCNFFLATTDAEGVCRRYPPVVIAYVNGPTASVFPAMQGDGWCGEWKEKEIKE